jgi:methionine synthase I (cobalamin-dependent)
MKERIRELAEQSYKEVIETNDYNGSAYTVREFDQEKFAELIVRECIDIAKNWKNQLEDAKCVSESNAVGIVAYRIARQFGVKQ